MAASSPPSDHVKLSEDVVPTHYALTIRTDLEEEEYEGRAEIDLEVNVATSAITFHLAEPTLVTYAALASEGLSADSLQVSSDITVDKERECATVTFGETLQPGTRAKLGLAFKGALPDSLLGYYKSTFEHEGRKGTYALTQFEPTAARKAFPCWDEPAVKATFSISLLSRSSTVSLSNMDVVSSTPSKGAFSPSPWFAAFGESEKGVGQGPAEKGPDTALDEKGPNDGPQDNGPSAEGPNGEWTLTNFATTPKMSTYLVAWANGEFQHIESSYTSVITGKKVNLRVYTTPEYITQAGLALDVKVRILPVYERMFDIAYPLPKLDTLVASDFGAGAMENWGLITGRTSAYLYDEKNSGIKVRKNITRTQSHEVAHQWFGNIVTMKWWDNLWLNESFATLLGAVIIIERIHPEWRPHADFINMHFDRALALDSLRSSHPIEVPCPDEKAVGQIFDAISYAKGASVLRMLSSMIGEDVFLKGVSIYLKNHLYGNTVTADLWRGISDASGVNVNEIMSSWILKVGYPLITVTETEKGLHLMQSRFLATNDVNPEEDETIWNVPLNIQTVGENEQVLVDRKAVLAERETIFEIANIGSSMYKLNAGTTGVYRVLYPPTRLSKLGDEAARKGSSLSAEDKMGLVSDSFVLAQSGHGSTSAALDLLNKLRDEEDYFVWSRMSSVINEVSAVWWEQPQEVQEGLNAFRRSLFGPLVEKLGFEPGADDSPDLIQWRITAINGAASSDEPKTMAEIKRRFNLLLDNNDGSQITGDLRRCIYTNSVRTGGVREWEKILEVYHHFETPSQSVSALLGLCTAKDSALIKRTLDMILTNEVKTQDYMYIIAGSGWNPDARRTTWEWMMKNLPLLEERLKGNSPGRLIRSAFDSFTMFEDIKVIEEYFKDKDTSTYVQALAQGLDDVRSKAAWLERDKEEVVEWLKRNDYA